MSQQAKCKSLSSRRWALICLKLSPRIVPLNNCCRQYLPTATTVPKRSRLTPRRLSRPPAASVNALIYPIAVPAVCFLLALFLMPETSQISLEGTRGEAGNHIMCFSCGAVRPRTSLERDSGASLESG